MEQMPKRTQNDKENISRRNFLKKTILAGAGAIVASYGIKNISQERALTENEKKQSEIYKQEKDAIGRTFTEQIENAEHITLDKKTKKAIYDYWYKKYAPGTKEYKDGLVAGLEQMRPWISEIRSIFAQYNVPEEYLFLAIPESHFEINAVSPKNAVGPYQIMRDTAKNFGMIVTKNYDERYDPIKSARLCARHLYSSWKKFGENWTMALMDYNGGFTNKYMRYVKKTETHAKTIARAQHTLQPRETLSDIALQYDTSVTLLKNINHLSDAAVRKMRPGTIIAIPQKRTITYDDFNRWSEDQINQEIDEKIKNPYYTVHSGDTLSAIAQKFSMSINILKSLNNLTSDTIHPQQKLHILIPRQRQKELMRSLLSNWRENINYPEKFYAIMDIIKKEGLLKLFDDTQKTYKEVHAPKVHATSFSHSVHTGDTLYGIARAIKKHYPQYGASLATIKHMLLQQNHIKNEKYIKPGQKITLRFPLQRPAALADIAKKYHTDLQTLCHLNPAVRNIHAQLPENITIRIPREK